MVQSGLPAPMVDVIVSIDEAIANGTLAVTSSTVEDLTGRAATSVQALLEAHAAALTAPRP